MNTPEELKRIAEALGYTDVDIVYGNVHYTTGKGSPFELDHVLDPLTNAEQREEILLYLTAHRWTLRQVNKRYVLNRSNIIGDSAIRRKNYGEALINAMLRQIDKG